MEQGFSPALAEEYMASGEDPSNGWKAAAAHLIASRGRSRIGISNIDEGENYYYAAARL